MEKRIFILENKELKDEISNIAYKSRLKSTKMYKYMNEYYWWLRIKGEMVGFVAKCAICQQVKTT
jgi:hypothetical protein